MKKDLPQLAIGRAVMQARRLVKANPRLVTEKEWGYIKTLLNGGWNYKKIAKEISRGVNTILRAKKSDSYLEYKSILQDEVDMRKDKKARVLKFEFNYGGQKVQAKPFDPILNVECGCDEEVEVNDHVQEELAQEFYDGMKLSHEHEEQLISLLRGCIFVLIGIFVLMLTYIFKTVV